jgi:pimeloyl-ACP methyl ester carboxylesterase
MIPPETHYVTVNGAQVAYQLAGSGSEDVTVCLPLGGQIDGFWQLPPGPELLSGLADVRRLIVFDRRGSGASDPLPPIQSGTVRRHQLDNVPILLPRSLQADSIGHGPPW